MAEATPWSRIFPDADHRWMMGLRPSDSVPSYFAHHDATGKMLAERAHWLDCDREKYVALLPEANTAILETAEFAISWGVRIQDRPSKSPGEAETVALDLAMTCEPDLVWMHPDGQGAHRLVGGAVCFPSSWDLGEMLGRPMNEVHALVPGLNDLLSRQIETFLGKMPAGAAWQRENWSLARDFDLNHHPSRSRPRLDATITPDEVCVRLEHQLLFKLPESGSVLFGIRLELVPLTTVLQDRLASHRLARLLTTISTEAASYKGIATARPALLEILRQAGAQ